MWKRFISLNMPIKLIAKILEINDGKRIFRAFLNENMYPKIIYSNKKIGIKIFIQVILIFLIPLEISRGKFI